MLAYEADTRAIQEENGAVKSALLGQESGGECPSQCGDALFGAAIGALIFLGLTLLLAAVGVPLAYWL